MEPIQKICLTLGNDGCYLLSIMGIAMKETKKSINPVELYTVALKNRWIKEDCFVNSPGEILGLLMGGAWTVEKVDGCYKPKTGEFVVYRYEVREGRNTIAHFVLPDWDPYGNSNTVQNGRLISSRVFRRV